MEQQDVDGQNRTYYRTWGRANDRAYASDGTRFVWCEGKIAAVLDSERMKVVVRLNAPDGKTLNRCCFSPDGRFVACAADETIFVWDITISGAPLVRQLVGHSGPVTFIAFSSSLISGSEDRSIKFWQSSDLLSSRRITDPSRPHGSKSILSANLFANDGTVVTTDENGAVDTWDLMTGRLKGSSPTPAPGLRDTYLRGDSLIIVWSLDWVYHVWDVYNNQLLRTLPTPPPFVDVKDLKISGDGSKIFLCGHGYIKAISMDTGELVGVVSFSEGEEGNFFVHCSKVGFSNLRSRGWDFGGPEMSYYGEFPDRLRLDLADWSAGSRCVEDTVTKKLVFRLSDRYIKSDMEMVWDGRYLLVWSSSGWLSISTVYPLDRVCRACVQ